MIEQNTQKINNELTEQEKKVLALLKEAKTNKEISEQLFISVSTVKTHVSHIFKKKSVKNRTKLML